MKQFNSRAVFPLLTLLVGVLWFVLGIVQYGYWHDGRALSGFFPTLIGGGLAGISFLAFMAELKEGKPSFMMAYLHPVLAALGMVIMALLVGFFPALAIYLFTWLKWYEKYSVKVSAVTTVVTTAAVYGIFYMWLRVAFPHGLLFGFLY